MHKKYEALADERKNNYLLQDQKQKDENNQKMTKIRIVMQKEVFKLIIYFFKIINFKIHF